MVDAARLKHSWSLVAANGDQVPLIFYSILFMDHPEVRDLFPLSMAAQRDRLVGALGHIVSHVDQVDELVPFLQTLGRDHRKFSVVADHYPVVGGALLATLEHFLGDEWTPDLAEDWTQAYTLVAKVMTEAAEEAAAHTPPWWNAEIIAHDRRTFDVAVLTIRPEHRYDYTPGQSIAVECPLRPRLWRYLSPANAPRDDGTIELHVRQVPGGPVSSALVNAVHTGDVLRLGAPVGDGLVLDPDNTSDLLLLAGGTGLAPLKALTEQVAQRAAAGHRHRRVALFLGVRTERELYDLESLAKLAQQHDWLSVVPTLDDDPSRRYEVGTVVDTALRLGRWHHGQVYVCGSDEMVAASVERLLRAGYQHEQLHYEIFTGSGGQRHAAADILGKEQRR